MVWRGRRLTPEAFGLSAARELERTIDELGEDNVAAFVAEPIQGAGGVDHSAGELLAGDPAHLPGAGYSVRLRRGDLRLRRTGSWFGCEYFGYEPDLMAMAKGISSGYLPIGGVMVSRQGR